MISYGLLVLFTSLAYSLFHASSSAIATQRSNYLNADQENPFSRMSVPSTETEASAAQTNWFISSSSAVCEIEEEAENPVEIKLDGNRLGLTSIKEGDDESSSLFSMDVNAGAEDGVYVAVGKSQSSMDALRWTLNHFDFVNTSSVLYLIHVFPTIHYIPSPLGMLPKNKVSPTQLESYMEQERGKRRKLLHKFIDVCSASKVKVETMLIESDMIAKAILDLIPILNITKLVVGTGITNSSNARKLIKSKIADQIFQNAPSSCEVKIVCDGEEVIGQTMTPLMPSPAPYYQDNSKESDADHRDDSFSCMCFKPKF